jgi:hypothetical protein
MPRVGFESTIPVFERAKTVHASDRAATVIGRENIRGRIMLLFTSRGGDSVWSGGGDGMDVSMATSVSNHGNMS